MGIEVMNVPVKDQITIIPTNTLPSGNYFYKVIDNEQTIQSGKVISLQ